MANDLAKLKKEIIKFAKARDWEQFHTPKNLSMAMAVEAGEVAEIFQWLTPAQSLRLNKAKRQHLADELGDVYVYLLKLAAHYDIDLIKAGRSKLKKSAKKYPVSKAKGIMRKYNEL
jgi:NTP pyrophosphatase (non-canonical NTP hydrolase)